jgi:opacity protein-like surface antigen
MQLILDRTKGFMITMSPTRYARGELKFIQGEIMKRHTAYVVLGLFLAVALVALAAPANAEMYVEGYLGGAAASNINQTVNMQDLSSTNVGPFSVSRDNHLQLSGTPDAAVLGGLKLGTWFVHEGFAGYSGYPDWMKYFGFYTDLGVQRLEMRASLNGTLNYKISYREAEESLLTDPTLSAAKLNSGDFTGDGTIVTWAFMFAGRYGFFPDAEVPFGRLQPYVAVGPAIMFSSLEAKINTNVNGPIILPTLSRGTHMDGGTNSSVNIALEAESGIRYMCTKNVSIELSFKYRYAQPSYTYSGYDCGLFTSNPATFKLNPVYQLFSGQLGVAYHF